MKPLQAALDELVQAGLMKTPDEEARRRMAAALADDGVEQAPWFVRVFVAVGTWVGALFLGGFLFAAHVLEHTGPAMILGLCLLAGAIALARSQPATVFFVQLIWVMTFCGQLSLLAAFRDSFGRDLTFVLSLIILLQLLVLVAIPLASLRLASTVAAVVALFALLSQWHFSTGRGLLALGLAVTVATLWRGDVILSSSRTWSAVWRPIGFGLAASMALPLAWPLLEPRPRGMPGIIIALGLALVILLVIATAYREQGWPLSRFPGPLVLASVPITALFVRDVPGLMAGLLLLVLGHLRRERGLHALALLYIAGFLTFFYYQMEIPLLQKSLWMSATGGVLLALPRLARFSATSADREPRRRVGDGLAGRGLTALAVVTLFALVLPYYLVWQKENLLAEGQTVLLKLRPVDPRSLMQGDYMELRYALDRDVEKLSEIPRSGKIVLQLDERNVARYVEPWDGRELRSREQLLRYRIRLRRRWGSSGLRLGAESFFFEEGTAKAYEAAAYGELKVSPEGEPVLVGLRDAALLPLGARRH